MTMIASPYLVIVLVLGTYVEELLVLACPWMPETKEDCWFNGDEAVEELKR